MYHIKTFPTLASHDLAYLGKTVIVTFRTSDPESYDECPRQPLGGNCGAEDKVPGRPMYSLQIWVAERVLNNS